MDCSELTSMTIPDSLQTFGFFAFFDCSKLVPSNIDVNNDVDDEDAVHRTKNQWRLPQVRSDEVIVSSFAIFYC